MPTEIEYRVVPVIRYIVTRAWREDGGPRQGGGVCERGEFPNENLAYEVAAALAETERNVLGYALDDPRMKFPKLPIIAAA